MKNNTNLQYLVSKMPIGYYVCGKMIWFGSTWQEINHVDHNLDNPLNYVAAFEKMLCKLGIPINN